VVSRRGRHRLAVEGLAVDGNKRRAVLLAVADFLDRGREDPSLAELTRRSPVNRASTAAILDRLEGEGLLGIERGDRRRDERSRYRLPGVTPAHTIDTKEKNTMPPTKTKATRVPLIEGKGQARFRCFRADWLPELGAVTWPRYAEARVEFLAALGSYDEAIEGGDLATEIERAMDLTDIIASVAETLPGYGEEARAAIAEVEALLRPDEPVALTSGITPQAQAEILAAARAREDERVGEHLHLGPLLREDAHVVREVCGGYRLKVGDELLKTNHKIRAARKALREKEGPR
jgi:hypothetical protein